MLDIEPKPLLRTIDEIRIAAGRMIASQHSVRRLMAKTSIPLASPKASIGRIADISERLHKQSVARQSDE